VRPSFSSPENALGLCSAIPVFVAILLSTNTSFVHDTNAHELDISMFVSCRVSPALSGNSSDLSKRSACDSDRSSSVQSVLGTRFVPVSVQKTMLELLAASRKMPSADPEAKIKQPSIVKRTFIFISPNVKAEVFRRTSHLGRKHLRQFALPCRFYSSSNCTSNSALKGSSHVTR